MQPTAGMSVKTNTCKIAQEDSECFCFAHDFVCVVGKNPKTPKLSPMVEDAITAVQYFKAFATLCQTQITNKKYATSLPRHKTYYATYLVKI